MLLPEIYIIRHGTTIANEEGVFAGAMETKLSHDGFSQAQTAGTFLSNITFARAFSSPMIRTRQTVAALDLNIIFDYDSRLRAMNFGELQGRPFALGRERGLVLPALFDDPDLHFPGGECYRDVEVRIQSFIDEKLDGSNGPAIVVTHGAAGMILLATLLPHLKNNIADFAQGNADVLRVVDGGFSVAFSPEKIGNSLDSPFGR